MKKIILMAAVLLYSGSLVAQSLGTAELKNLKESFNNDAYAKSIHNIVSSNKNIKALAYDASVARDADDFFKYRVDVKGITD